MIQRKNRAQLLACAPTPISAAPATRKKTPLSVTVATVEGRVKHNAATPSTTSKRAEGDDLAPARAQMLDGDAEAWRPASVGCVAHGASPLRPARF